MPDWDAPPLQARLLVVDDDIAQRVLMQETLSQAGMTVSTAANGLEAVELFQTFKPDLILMDIKMPVMDGLEACYQIRQLDGGGNVPIVLITGMDDQESIRKAFEMDATDFMTKPVNWPILNHKVRYILKASKAFNTLRESEIRLSEAQRIAALGSWEWDRTSNRMYWSDQVYIIFGLSPGSLEITLESFLESIHPEDRGRVKRSVELSLNDSTPMNTDYRIVRPDGTERSVNQQGEVISVNQGALLSMRGTIQDITERKKFEQRIHRLAYYDTLTKLPNRIHFKNLVQEALELTKNSGKKVALLYLDLDEFKRINDTLGHDIGDELLKAIAKNLQVALRSSDSVVRSEALPGLALSRLGGDEFTILVDGIDHADQVSRIAQRLLAELGKPVFLEDQEFFITGCIGISIFPDDGADVESLLKNADIAMYQAKKKGRNEYKLYSSLLNRHSKTKLGMEAKLRRALERDELLLHYQPQISTQTGEVEGVEALVRWQDPDAGLVPPGQFIPVAEDSGLILPIGDWVMQTACRQAAQWHQQGMKSLKMSVNFSGYQFRQHNFANNVKRVLDGTGLDPKYLELEMTESVIMQQVEKTITDLKMLKDVGVAISIDDFGTGYSSMSYLKRFPLDVLKIDRSFINDIATNESDAAIVRAIIRLAQSLNISTVAEGVEHGNQFSILQQQGCHLIQGFFFCRPVPPDEVEKFISGFSFVGSETNQPIKLHGQNEHVS